MADKHPYVQSPGHLVQAVEQFRKSFPGSVTAETLKRFGCAPNNESYVVNTLRFLGLVDSDSNKTDLAGQIFSLHQDDKFQKAFGDAVEKAYVELFSLHGEDSWKLDTDGLITFFRQADQSSATVGRRQAYTFVAMSGLAGHSDLLNTKKPSNRTKNPSHRMKSKDAKNATGKAESFTSPKKTSPSTGGEPVLRQAVGLTVRIEVNLPASGDQATYDRIFKSIRENLLNG